MPTSTASSDHETFDLEVRKAADGFNKPIGADQALGVEPERVRRVVGKEGKLSSSRWTS